MTRSQAAKDPKRNVWLQLGFPDAEEHFLKAEMVLPAGGETFVMVGPLKAGTYEFHDEYNEDVSKTKLIVK